MKKAPPASVPASFEDPAFAGLGGPETEPTHAAGLDLGTLKPAAYWVPIEVVKRWERNPRVNEAAVPGVMTSIQRFGFGAPLLARVEDGELIAGDTRIQAAERLGWTQLPVRFMDLVAQEAGMMALADNKHGGLWDEVKLAEIVKEAAALGETFEGVGFTDKEIAELCRPANAGDGDGEGDGPELGGGLRYQVVVTCEGELHQAEIIEELERKGLSCRPLIL